MYRHKVKLGIYGSACVVFPSLRVVDFWTLFTHTVLDKDNFGLILRRLAFAVVSTSVKGSQVFFMNQWLPGPQVFRWARFEFFRKFAEIFANEYLSTPTPAINCSAV